MKNRTEYKNQYAKDHYDRINMQIPKGYKERIKARADSLGVGMSDYIFTLICNDLYDSDVNIADQKQGITDEDMVLLGRLRVSSIYYKMIENISLSKGDYYIQLKAGYINDITKSREIHVKTIGELRAIIIKSHKLGLEVKEVPAADWLSSETIHQLEKWQIPKKYYTMIDSVTVLNGLYSIHLLEGYVNDKTGANRVDFKSVSELRTVMKYTHKAV